MNGLCSVMVVSVLVLVGVLLASKFYPEALWAVHFIHLLDFKLRALLLILAGVFTVGGLAISKSEFETGKTVEYSILRFIVPILVGITVLALPIAFDDHGDARYIREGVDISISTWNWRLLTEPLQPDFLNTKVGLMTFYELNNFFTWLFGANGTEVTPWLQAVFAFLVVFVWIRLVSNMINDVLLSWTMIIVFLTAPLMMVFMSHFETYFLSYTGVILWFALLAKVFKSKHSVYLYWLTAFFPFLLQTHITNWLLLPSLVFAWVYVKPQSWLGRAKSWVDALLKRVLRSFNGGLSWMALTAQFIVPAILLLFVAYFFIWENHDGPRQFSKEEFEDTLFLPLYTNEFAPLDRYNLFSWNHLVDRFNLLLLRSPGLLLLALPLVTFLRRSVDWKNPLLVVSGSTFIVVSVVFFLLNPLLGLTEDWDLFMAPALVLFPTVVFAYSTIESPIPITNIVGPALGFAILMSSLHWVNANSSLLSDHYQIIGKRKFKTYWIGSSTTILASAELLEDLDECIIQLENDVEELRPLAAFGNDKEFANLLTGLGQMHRENGDLKQALDHFLQATQYSADLGTNLYNLCVTQFELQKYTASLETVERLVALKYQPFERTLRVAVHVALAAQDYQRAADFAVTYLNRYSDPVISEVEERLRTGRDIGSLIDLFGNSTDSSP